MSDLQTVPGTEVSTRAFSEYSPLDAKFPDGAVGHLPGSTLRALIGRPLLLPDTGTRFGYVAKGTVDFNWSRGTFSAQGILLFHPQIRGTQPEVRWLRHGSHAPGLHGILPRRQDRARRAVALHRR